MQLANSFGFFLLIATYMLFIWGYWRIMSTLVGELIHDFFAYIHNIIFHDMPQKQKKYHIWN
jgi:hypothetical protein